LFGIAAAMIPMLALLMTAEKRAVAPGESIFYMSYELGVPDEHRNQF
jgi:hypothetical protein